MRKNTSTAREKNKANGTIRIQLEESYSYHDGLRPGHDYTTYSATDSNTTESNRLIKAIKKLGDEQGGTFSEEHNTHRSDPSRMPHFDGGITTYVSELWTLVFGGGTAIAFLKAAQPFLLQWMKNHNGRSVTIKKGNAEIEIKGSGDIEKALELFRSVQKKSRKKK